MRSTSTRDVELTCRRVNRALGTEQFTVARGGTVLYEESPRSHRDLLWGTKKEVLCFLEGFEHALDLAARSK
jgi:hypothetical protein